MSLPTQLQIAAKRRNIFTGTIELVRIIYYLPDTQEYQVILYSGQNYDQQVRQAERERFCHDINAEVVRVEKILLDTGTNPNQLEFAGVVLEAVEFRKSLQPPKKQTEDKSKQTSSQSSHGGSSGCTRA